MASLGPNCRSKGDATRESQAKRTMKLRCKKRCYSVAVVLFLAAFFVGGMRPAVAPSGNAQEPKKPPALAQDDRVWRVTLAKSSRGYHVVSVTNLDGAFPAQTPKAEITSGAFQNWRWKVEADPSLLPSWMVWQSDKKVQKSARLPADDWSYPALDWRRAFERGHQVVSYLLGRQPLSLDARVILVPEGSDYHQTFDQEEDGAIPLTLGLYYPSGVSSSRADQSERFLAMVAVVTRVISEYEGILVAAGTIESVGQDEAARVVNEEGQSICWDESTFLALGAGTHFVSRLGWDQQGSADELAHYPPAKIKLSDAVHWGALREAESIGWYLEFRGMKNHTFSAKDPAAMNAVLSVCRAMTQHPFDLTTGAYPAPQIQYVPFFPATLASRGAQKNTQ
jgi:hypothetical protein